jgi:DNA-binding XRE family transcriptional regulator
MSLSRPLRSRSVLRPGDLWQALTVSPTPISSAHVGLGLAIRRLREERGISQKELAGLTGLHPTYVSGVERGVRNPSWSVIVALAQALDVTPAHVAELVAHLGGPGGDTSVARTGAMSRRKSSSR